MVICEYGKSKVHLMRRVNDAAENVMDMTVECLLAGDFTDAFKAGDNRMIVPTDTIKNMIFAVAARSVSASPENYALELSELILERHLHVESVRITVLQTSLDKILPQICNHAYRAKSLIRVVKLNRHRDEAEVEIASGYEGYRVMKLRDSGFEEYLVDEYTTLQPTRERVMATDIGELYHWSRTNDRRSCASYNQTFVQMLRHVDEVFAREYSPSIQATLYLIAREQLMSGIDITLVDLTMPNIHYMRFDKEDALSLPANTVYIKAGEPHGLIRAQIRRKDILSARL